MFDISFSELMLIAVVALLVIGPEKLPKVARTAGLFVGKLQRYVSQVKEEINRETRFESLQTLQKEIEASAQSIGRDLDIRDMEINADQPADVSPAAGRAQSQIVTGDTHKRRLKKSAYIKRENFRKIPHKQTLKNHLHKNSSGNAK